MKIHHNTLKKAKAHNLAISGPWENGDFQVLSLTSSDILATAKDPKDALDLALLEIKPVKLKPRKAKSKVKATRPKRRRPDDDMEDGEGDEEDNSKSIVKEKYRQRYAPNKGNCGDDLAKKLRHEFMTRTDEDTGRALLDFNRFVAFAKDNEVWVEGYRRLKNRDGSRNDGLIRMNVANRLRAKVRKGGKVKW
jgi:hypothetical protein